jgi:hypothetical protein
MTARQRFQLAQNWIWLLALLRAIDFGLRLGNTGSLVQDLPSNAVALGELSVHIAVIAGLKGRRRWGWVLAATWYPVWIVLMTVRLYAGYDVVLGLLWTPFFLLTAIAHSALLTREIREAFGVVRPAWAAVQRWLPSLVIPGALVLAATYSFGLSTAFGLWITTAIAYGTADQVYRAN